MRPPRPHLPSITKGLTSKSPLSRKKHPTVWNEVPSLRAPRSEIGKSPQLRHPALGLLEEAPRP